MTAIAHPPKGLHLIDALKIHPEDTVAVQTAKMASGPVVKVALAAISLIESLFFGILTVTSTPLIFFKPGQVKELSDHCKSAAKTGIYFLEDIFSPYAKPAPKLTPLSTYAQIKRVAGIILYQHSDFLGGLIGLGAVGQLSRLNVSATLIKTMQYVGRLQILRKIFQGTFSENPNLKFKHATMVLGATIAGAYAIGADLPAFMTQLATIAGVDLAFKKVIIPLFQLEGYFPKIVSISAFFGTLKVAQLFAESLPDNAGFITLLSAAFLFNTINSVAAAPIKATAAKLVLSTVDQH